jgi:2-dehydrotetronate isomerase
MLQFAANLSMMYTDLPFLDRFEAAAKDGFKAVEYLFPYDFEASELATRLSAHDLQQVLFNAPPGGTDKLSIAKAWALDGSKGTACVPGREDEFRAGVDLALRYAEVLKSPRIHLMAGLIPVGLVREDVQATYLSNLRWAANQIASAGLDALIEPINTRDIPRFFLNCQDHAHEIIATIGARNLKVQMDLYHCQIVEGDVAMRIRKYLPTGNIGHFQIASVPERHEPDAGELNYGYLFKVIDEVSQQCDWKGWIGCEYHPKKGGQAGGTSQGLGWLRQYQP